MPSIGIKKTFNLHKVSMKAKDLFSNWKFILPLIFSFAGLILGSTSGKGKVGLYQKITEYYISVIMTTKNTTMISELIKYLLLPTIFATIAFFIGLCVFGSLVVNVIPLSFGFIIGTVSYYMYSTYTLKGLAYCVILLFPYAVMSLFSIILCCRESISMSEYLVKSLSKSSKFIEYNFSYYYKNYLKSYVYIVFAAILKTALDYLFIELFSF